MAALEEFLVVLKAQTGEFTGGLAKASGEIKKVEAAGGGAFQKLAGVGKAAFAGIIGGAVAGGIAAVKLADDYDVAHARLVTALKNTGTSWDAQKKKIEAVTQTGERLGFSMKDTEDALAVMTRGMGSSDKATQNLALAQDLARAKGIDLATAATTITRASEGQLRPLKQLGIDLPVAAAGALKVKQAQDALSKAWAAAATVQDKIRNGQLKGKAAQNALQKSTQAIKDAQDKLNTVQSTGGQILDALGQKLGGSAARQADTFGGKLQTLKVQFQDIGVRIGEKLIPILEKLGTVISGIITWFEKHTTVAKILAVVIGVALVAAVGAYTVSMISAAVATIAATWPILAIIAAVALLVAGIWYLWNNWDKIWNWIKNHKALAAVVLVLFPIIGVIALIIAALKWLQTNWDTVWPEIKKTVEDTWNQIKPVVENAMLFIRGVIDLVMGLLTGDWSRAWHGLNEIMGAQLNDIKLAVLNFIPDLLGIWHSLGQQMANALVDGFRQVNPGNLIAAAVKAWIPAPMRSFLSHAPGLGWLDHLAGGGLAVAGQPYLVGEMGPELFIPGSSGRVVPNGKLAGFKAGGGGGTVINLTVNALDPRGAEDAVVKALKGWARRNGPVPVRIASGS